VKRHFLNASSPAALLLALGLISCAGPSSATPQEGSGATNFRLLGENGTHWSDNVIDPISMPYLFEPPMIRSNVQAIAIHHEFPETGVVGGGDLQAFAIQGRLALTDRLALIAVKDGYVDFNPGGLPDDEGYADIAGGAKFAFYDDGEARLLLTGGLTYEGTNGDVEVLQGNGAGMWRPFLTGLWGGDAVNTILTVGGSLPQSSGREPTSIDAHLHLSPADFGDLVPLIELNGIHYIDDANGPPVSLELVDYGTLGSSQVKGQTFVSGAIGGRWRMTERMDLGLAYEKALTTRKYIFDQRVTADWVIRF